VVQFALLVQETGKHERFSNSFYRSFENSVRVQPKPSSQEYSENERWRHVGAARTVHHTGGERPTVPRSANRAPPQALGTSKPRRPYAVTSAKA